MSSTLTLLSLLWSHLWNKVWVEIERGCRKDNGGSVTDVGSPNTLASESVQSLSELIDNKFKHT